MSIIFHNSITDEGKQNPYADKGDTADVCLLLEGTYPFVSGGVSSWVHALINGLPELTFNLFVILPDNKKRNLCYEIPQNVNALFLHPLNQPSFSKKSLLTLPKNENYLDEILNLHRSFNKTPASGLNADVLDIPKSAEENLYSAGFDAEHLLSMFKRLIRTFDKQDWSISKRVFSRKTWETIKGLYLEKGLDCSFVDYFWTWRYLHLGIFSLLNTYIPKSGVYHAVSTGYAGFLGARASLKYNSPLILTEHGIYNKERKIDISRSPWIYEERRHQFRAQQHLEVFKELWIKAFTIMSKICYESSSAIITLYMGNQEFQKQDGANPEIMQVIPNGIDYQKLSQLKRDPQPKKIIGFVGRIVPIKDVKTFIRAFSIVLKSFPNVEAWLLGPTDENEQYYQECVQLVEFLEIEDNVRFAGMVDLQHYYPKLDILVLTSISEAQPLVILEAYSLGIPVVASDVGACRELIEGTPGDDEALGKGGLVTGLTNPTETALSVMHLLRYPEEAEKMGLAGKQRVKKYYDLPKLFERYKTLYGKHLKGITEN